MSTSMLACYEKTMSKIEKASYGASNEEPKSIHVNCQGRSFGPTRIVKLPASGRSIHLFFCLYSLLFADLEFKERLWSHGVD